MNVRVVHFARNGGHQIAVSAGFDMLRGTNYYNRRHLQDPSNTKWLKNGKKDMM